MDHKDLPIIGNNVLVDIAGLKDVPAKIDTGADSSSLWASDITVNRQNELEFCLLGPKHPLYTGEKITTKDFSIQQVRNSTGDVSIRYRVNLSIKLHGKRIRANFNLMDRSRNRFPILIGRKTIQNKFLVDVSRVAIKRPATFDNQSLNDELREDPRAFHQKYMNPSNPKTPTRFVFWTSGWDSTYMVIKLLRDGFTVQPIYVNNHKRKSRHHELKSLSELSALISERISSGKLLPIKIIPLEEIKIDPEITAAFDSILRQLPAGQRPLGYQYRYLASFAKQNHADYPYIALGIEHASRPEECACSAVIQQFGKLDQQGRIIPKQSSPELNTLFGNFEFPIMDTSEPAMLKNIQNWQYEDIMQHIWFCHRPIHNQPCGICNPCSSKIASGMQFLLPSIALERNAKFAKIQQKYGKTVKKLYERLYRLFHH